MVNIEISESAYAYLKTVAVPFEDTPLTALDKVIAEHRSGKQAVKEAPTAASESALLVLKFDSTKLPNVSFTTVTGASIAGKNASKLYWNNIVEDLIVHLASKGIGLSQIQDATKLHIRSGEHADNGYRYVPAAGLSFQGLDANRACENIARLSRAFDVPVRIDVRWQVNEKAQHPDTAGQLIFP